MHVRAGSYPITILGPDGTAYHSPEVDVLPGEVTDLGSLNMGARPVRGIVVNESGQSIADAVVTFRGSVVRSGTSSSSDESDEVDALEVVRDILCQVSFGDLDAAGDSPPMEGGRGAAESGVSTLASPKAAGTLLAETPCVIDRERLEARVAAILSQAEKQTVREITELALTFPADIFNRRNLWGMRCS